jgi:hypothetical protein
MRPPTTSGTSTGRSSPNHRESRRPLIV